jgi:hypothetical protein
MASVREHLVPHQEIRLPVRGFELHVCDEGALEQLCGLRGKAVQSLERDG